MRSTTKATRLHSVWILLSLAAPPCQEANPDFDGAPPETSTTSGVGSSGGGEGPVTTLGSTSGADGTSGVVTGGMESGSGSTTSTTTGGPATGGNSDASGGGSSTGACEMCGGDTCVDLMTDAAHCGMCDHGCPGNQICVAADCVPGN
jgi:hypothetical protein